MILDARGRPIRSRRPIVGRELAGIGGGRDVTRGYVDDQLYLSPQDKVLRYQGANNYEIYEDILRDDRVQSTFAQRRAAVVAREWEVTPGGSLRRDRMAADHLREMLAHAQWDATTNKMLYGVHYGYSAAEMMWARDGRHVAIDAIRVRNRRRFVFGGDDFHLRLLTTDDPQGEPLPERKFWTFASGADNDDEPYGRGLAYHLYWPVWFKKNQVAFWLQFLNKFGAPTAATKYPRGSTDATERRRALEVAEAIHARTAIAVPDDLEVELVEARRSGAVDYEAFYQRMQDAITTIVLSQTMTTEDGSSLSQAKVHMDVRREVVEADASLIDESFRRGPAAWLTEWNYPGAAAPRVRRIMEDPAALKGLAERDQIIVAMGHRLTRDYVERTYHVELEEAEPRADPPDPRPDPPPPAANLAEDEDDAPDVLAARARREIGPVGARPPPKVVGGPRAPGDRPRH